MLRDGTPMRALPLALLLVLPAAAARAEPAQEARSATAACLSAVLNNAPVEDIDGDDVSIRRGKDPVSCTVRVAAGEPVVIRDAVITAIQRRVELFQPAKTRWQAAAPYASRETFCNLPGRRAVSVVVSTGKPGAQPVLVATVLETAKRDERCDKDLGLQVATAEEPTAPTAAPTAAPPPDEVAAPAPKPEKKPGWLRRKLGLGKDG
jgi:hypothetical protein